MAHRSAARNEGLTPRHPSNSPRLSGKRSKRVAPGANVTRSGSSVRSLTKKRPEVARRRQWRTSCRVVWRGFQRRGRRVISFDRGVSSSREWCTRCFKFASKNAKNLTQCQQLG